MRKLADSELGYELWHKYAHLIENVKDNFDPNLTRLQKYACECDFLFFKHSALSAKQYVEYYVCEELKETPVFCEIWNIKEGHTSSVWRVLIANNKKIIKDEFVLNIARDKEAGIELKVTSEKLRFIAKKFPEINVAKVFDIQTLKSTFDQYHFEVVVTRNEWIKDSYEIHEIKDTLNGGKLYFLIEKFLTREKTPSEITSVLGRKFLEDETIKINHDINLFLANAASCFPIDIEINHGDVVWDGKRAVIVAIS